MELLRKHWVDLGGIVAIIIVLFLLINHTTISVLQTILWISFVSLLLHQLEEYRYPGNFSRNFNKVFFRSTLPDRYPLNTQSIFIINVCFGWTIYLLAIVFADKAIWLAIASFMTSIGNIVIHTFILNFKAKTLYNPGMLTSLVFFLPISIWFFLFIHSHGLASSMDYILGILLGVIINYFGIVKVADAFKDKGTKFIISQ